jgi:hypothetical protein
MINLTVLFLTFTIDKTWHNFHWIYFSLQTFVGATRLMSNWMCKTCTNMQVFFSRNARTYACTFNIFFFKLLMSPVQIPQNDCWISTDWFGYNATRVSCFASAILAPYSSAILTSHSCPLLRKRPNPPIGEGWLSILRWLNPLKLSKVGLWGSHGRRLTTTGPLSPFCCVFADE